MIEEPKAAVYKDIEARELIDVLNQDERLVGKTVKNSALNLLSGILKRMYPDTSYKLCTNGDGYKHFKYIELENGEQIKASEIYKNISNYC